VSHCIDKACAARLSARVPTAFSKSALTAQIVFDKRAIDEFAFCEAAACERGATKDAVLQLNIHKRCGVEETPIPL
jgi:hypothetical protein